ncbi:MAG: alpha/beta hydrolase [Acidobacteria bacterium]|nr:alpha/beta hydrolase [Acidobacteriota bacterium]
MSKLLANPRIATSLVVSAIALIGIAAATRLQDQSSRSILTRPAPPPDHRIAYGKDPLQFGELRLPKGSGPHPVAVIIHGGCWMAEFGLSYMGHLAANLTEAGIATWNIEYRRVGNEGGGWPGTFQDVALGTEYLGTLAKTHSLDLNRVIAIGHSAGGHLALWLAARKKLPKDSPLHHDGLLQLQGAIPLAAITDLRRTGTACDRIVSKLMGGSPEDYQSRYQQASPIELLPLGVKQIVIQGETDNIVPVAMAKDYAEAAKRKGDDVKLVVIEKAGHFELVDPQSFAWPKVKDEVMELVKFEKKGDSK